MSAVSSGSRGWRAKSSRMSRSTRSSLRISASWLLSSRDARSRLSSRSAAFEVHGVAAADGGVAEGGGQEGLADADGAQDQGVVAGVDEAQRAQLVETWWS